MKAEYLDTENLPFCLGCSHHLIARNTQKALQKMDIDPLDVILVTDIGCHGIIDSKFSTHTVHGLHGRSVALGAGISAALSDPSKKIIVFIGDGGVSIGLHHLIGAARRNFNMTVVVHNNMLYGMTGGQQSDLTPDGFTTRSLISGMAADTLDVMEITKDAGAAYLSRIVARGDFSDQLLEAFQAEGFSMVEVIEVCTSYGWKYNRGISMNKIEEQFNIPLRKHKNHSAKSLSLAPRQGLASLFDDLEDIPVRFNHDLKGQLSVVIGGSAGEGVQLASDIFARAAMSCGLKVTKKGSYPVTVGIGYSVVEIILSTTDISFTGISDIQMAAISSHYGLAYFRNRLEAMKTGYIVMDDQLDLPRTGAAVSKGSFRKLAGPKNCILMALLVLLYQNPFFPAQAFLETLGGHKVAEKIDLKGLNEHALNIAREPINGI
jgi:pyruvate/2-oxoacid:ferredoxin oxidoreductase beta subunit